MICINRELCNGCGACAQVCPVSAITLVDERVIVDNARCEGCRECVEACPRGALTWEANSSALAVSPSVGVTPATAKAVTTNDRTNDEQVITINMQDKEIEPQGRSLLPAVGSALLWAGREVVPRLAPLALNMLDRILERSSDAPVSREQAQGASATGRGAGPRGKGQRKRRRCGRGRGRGRSRS